MEVYTPSAPIYGVNNDVLLCIFTLNANMFFDRQALHTARATSQVCRQWRDLMLEAPLLWAKLIDMDICDNDGKLDWINEIIRRSGTVAPLWIKAEVNGRFRWHNDADNIKQFFKDLLENNWYRIQKLVILHDPHSTPRFSLTFPMLRFPAPQLENFTMRRTSLYGYSYRNIAPIKSLFANHAPMLRSLHLEGFTLHYQAPWIHQLHTMLLDGAYSVREALTVLSATNSLRELKINEITYGTNATSLPFAALPHLTYLEFSGEPTHYATLLNHITIPADCSLIIRMRYPREQPRHALEKKPEQVASVLAIFVRHARGYLESHKFDTFHIDCKPGLYLTLKIVGKLPVECVMSISTPLHDDLVPRCLHIMSRIDLSSVTTFQLRTDGPLLPQCFRTFFRMLPSVHTIHVDPVSLNHLSLLQSAINITRKPFIIFPRLKVIHFSISNDTHVLNVDKEFFLSRLENGHPIEILDISNGLPFTSPPNLDAIEVVEGLKVRYKMPQTREVFEHKCGGRDPARECDGREPANQCSVGDSRGREVWVECGSLQAYELWIEAGNL